MTNNACANCGQDNSKFNLRCHQCGVEILVISEQPKSGGGSPSIEDQGTHMVSLGAEKAGGSSSGDRIGPYHLLQKLGEGGMGEVFLAEQTEPVRRKVALKVIKHGMDSREVVARFESERQALAMMSHANIARIFDAGQTEKGRPFFVMEYIKGIPITDHCDKHRLKVRDRLGIFLQVCEGVQHAHQKAIIHRDLKPSNILVTIQEGQAVPKIIDFGVARAIDQRLTERTLFTELGQMVGTPEYMSPEQAEMTGQDIDTRSDIYSLGVILYELLAGALPFDPYDLRNAGLYEIQRKIREDEPPRPSTRVSTLGKKITEKAASRRTEPVALAKQLRRDLDWITMKSIDKDRTRRYGSSAEFAADIGRFLRNEAVEASPPSVAYRLMKFTRRHRIAVSSGLSIALLLIIFAVTAVWQASRIAEERDRAELEASRATAVNDFLVDVLGSANPVSEDGKSDITLLEALQHASREAAVSFENQPDIEASLKRTIGLTYSQLYRYELAEPLLRSVLDTRRSLHGNNHADVAESLEDIASMLRGKVRSLSTAPGKSDYAEAESLVMEALEIRRQLSSPDDPSTAVSLNELAMLKHNYDQEAARDLYRQAIRIQQQAGNESIELADMMSNLAWLLGSFGDYTEGEKLLRQAITIRQNLGSRIQPSDWQFLGIFLFHKGDFAGAETEFAKAVAQGRQAFQENPSIMGSLLWSLGWAQVEQGKYAEAEPILTEALQLHQSFFAANGQRPDQIRIAETLFTLAEVYAASNRTKEAEEHYQEAMTILGSESQPDWETGWARTLAQTSYGIFLTSQSRYPEAESQLLAAHALAPEFGEGAMAENAATALMKLYLAWGKPEQAAKIRAERTNNR